MTTELHQRLMALAYKLSLQGDVDLSSWIQKHIAMEQASKRRRRRPSSIKVKLPKGAGTAWVPRKLVKEAMEDGSNHG